MMCSSGVNGVQEVGCMLLMMFIVPRRRWCCEGLKECLGYGAVAKPTGLYTTQAGDMLGVM